MPTFTEYLPRTALTVDGLREVQAAVAEALLDSYRQLVSSGDDWSDASVQVQAIRAFDERGELPQLIGGVVGFDTDSRTRSYPPRPLTETSFDRINERHTHARVEIGEMGNAQVIIEDWPETGHLRVSLYASDLFPVPIAPLERLFDRIIGVLSKYQSDVPAISEPFRVFLAHGRSPVWRWVERVIRETGAEVVAFESEERASQYTAPAILEMIASCYASVIVMTAEDEMVDGTKRARENVVHELGLSQGTLGIPRTLVLLEEGSSEPSNILGLTQIRFPPTDIYSVESRIVEAITRFQSAHLSGARH